MVGSPTRSIENSQRSANFKWQFSSVVVNSCNTVFTRYQLIVSRICDKFELTPRTNANLPRFNFSVTNVSLNLNIIVVQLADSAFAASTNGCFRPCARTKVG